MIALALSVVYWSSLDSNHSIYEEIRRRLNQALNLKRNFAEAKHLLGMVYYRRGRLLERQATHRHMTPDTSLRYLDDFKSSLHHFRYAINDYYSRSIRRNAARDYFASAHEQNRMDALYYASAAHHLTFSPRTASFQKASLHAWRAYAMYMRYSNPLVRLQYDSKQTQDDEDDDWEKLEENQKLNRIDEELKNARQEVRKHPLVLFVQAKLNAAKGLHSDAINVFEELLDIIAPIDPKQRIGPDEIGDYSQVFSSQEAPFRVRMYVMEKLAGRSQFRSVVNRVSIFMEIARVYRQIDEPALRVKYLNEAVRWSSYADVDLNNLISLANQLMELEQYDDALAIVEAIRATNANLNIPGGQHG